MEATYSCVVCGKEFRPVRLAQKYCSKICRDRSGKNDRRFSGIRDYIIGRDNFKCAQCGSNKDLLVHHRDWIRTNNDPSNLITLCRSCHKKEHFEITDHAVERKCLICGEIFFPLRTKRKTQLLCRRQACKAKYKAMKKRSIHNETTCIICGKTFEQKHSQHHCCGKECRSINDDRNKAERYVSKREELKAKQIRYYHEHKEDRKAYIKRWQTENPEKVRAYKEKSALKHLTVLPSSLSG